jgi:hypothetical protein
MASSAGIFFAGIGTAFIIIGAGFGGGLMFANSAVHNVPAQMRASSHLMDPVRIHRRSSRGCATPCLGLTTGSGS